MIGWLGMKSSCMESKLELVRINGVKVKMGISVVFYLKYQKYSLYYFFNYYTNKTLHKNYKVEIY